MDATQPDRPAPSARVIGRYALFDEIGRGGMATVHIGRMLGPVGFARTVAIKRMRPQASEFASMFVDEARICARIHHPNVVTTLDVVTADEELLLVLEYIHGESLATIWRKLAAEGRRVPPRIAGAIAAGVLRGLHAAHEATDERGESLGVIHRDVSPHNVLVGADGIPRVLDFGIAKASGRLTTTRGAELKGKLSYMAPEQFMNQPLSRKADIFAASVVLWEALTGKRLYPTESEASTVHAVLLGAIPPPSKEAPDLPSGLDEVVLCGLERTPEARYENARAMALAIEQCVAIAPMEELGEWLRDVAKESLRARAEMIASIESIGDVTSVAMARSGPFLPDDGVEGETTAATIASGVAAGALAPAQRSFPWWGLVAIGAASGAIVVSALLGTARRGDSRPTQASMAAPPSAAAPAASQSAAAVPAVAGPTTAESSAAGENAPPPPADSRAATTTPAAATATSEEPAAATARPQASATAVHRTSPARTASPAPAGSAVRGLPPGLPDQRE